MNPILIPLLPILLILPALYLLFTRRSGRDNGTEGRPDEKERPELTGRGQQR